MTESPDAETVADPHAPAATGDRACLSLAVASVISWLATAATSNLVLALLSLVVMAALAGVAAYTVVPRTAGRIAPRVVATALAAVTAGVFVVAVDAACSWAIPAVALGAGLPTARAPRLRLLALAVTGAFVAALWIFGLDR